MAEKPHEIDLTLHGDPADSKANVELEIEKEIGAGVALDVGLGE